MSLQLLQPPLKVIFFDVHLFVRLSSDMLAAAQLMMKKLHEANPAIKLITIGPLNTKAAAKRLTKKFPEVTFMIADTKAMSKPSEALYGIIPLHPSIEALSQQMRTMFPPEPYVPSPEESPVTVIAKNFEMERANNKHGLWLSKSDHSVNTARLVGFRAQILGKLAMDNWDAMMKNIMHQPKTIAQEGIVEGTVPTAPNGIRKFVLANKDVFVHALHPDHVDRFLRQDSIAPKTSLLYSFHDNPGNVHLAVKHGDGSIRHSIHKLADESRVKDFGDVLAEGDATTTASETLRAAYESDDEDDRDW